MVSKAIASLDAWLARAEEVLAEQREQAISPSLGPLEGDGGEKWTITLAALFRRPGAAFWSHCALVLEGGF